MVWSASSLSDANSLQSSIGFFRLKFPDKSPHNFSAKTLQNHAVPAN